MADKQEPKLTGKLYGEGTDDWELADYVADGFKGRLEYNLQMKCWRAVDENGVWFVQDVPYVKKLVIETALEVLKAEPASYEKNKVIAYLKGKGKKTFFQMVKDQLRTYSERKPVTPAFTAIDSRVRYKHFFEREKKLQHERYILHLKQARILSEQRADERFRPN